MRTWTIALLALSILALQPAQAGDWYEGEYQDCAQAQSTADIVECVGRLYDRWDARLNAAYREIMGDMVSDRKPLLRDVQRNWIAYRDADCGFYASGEGSIARIEGSVCMYALTRDRARELEMMLQD